MGGELEKLAYEAALRGLDKQESLLEALRARTGVLLAASSLAASFLGQEAFRHPSPRGLYDGLYEVRDDRAEIYRRLVFDLDRFWTVNNRKIRLLTRAHGVAAISLIVEILSMAALLGGILT